MTFQQELNSWMSPQSLKLSPAPEIGSKAPTAPKLPFPNLDNKPIIVTFLRHCGCPFAEKTFILLREQAGKFPEVQHIAISHSSPESTTKWTISVGGEWDVRVIIDQEREVYAQWGLGVSSVFHVLNPWSLWSVYKLGRKDKIWNRPTESGNRWQTSGSFAVDKDGVVRWARVAAAADDVPDFGEALKALGIEQQERVAGRSKG